MRSNNGVQVTGKYANEDIYTYSRNDVLKNKLGIRNQEALSRAENYYYVIRHYQLAKEPMKGDFDLAHFQAVHQYLFQDIYEWAGKLRKVDIIKESTHFAHFKFIESSAKTLFMRLKQENYLSGLARSEFISRIIYSLKKF